MRKLSAEVAVIGLPYASSRPHWSGEEHLVRATSQDYLAGSQDSLGRQF